MELRIGPATRVNAFELDAHVFSLRRRNSPKKKETHSPLIFNFNLNYIEEKNAES